MLLRPGNAGSSTFTGHKEVLAAALRQVPARFRRKILVRVDGAGASHDLISHLLSLSSRRSPGRLLLTLGSSDVLMTQAEYFADPAACLVKNGEEEAVPQPGAGIKDRLHLGGSQYPRQLLRRLQRDGPAPIRLARPCSTWCRNGFYPPRPPVLHTASRSPAPAPFRA
jgi:hypothetical protein